MEAPFGTRRVGFFFSSGGLPMWERCKALWRCLFTPRPIEPYRGTKWESDWQDELAWYKQASSKDGIDYQEIKDFSEKKYSEFREVHDALDKKAEWLFGIATTAAGAIFVAIKSWGFSWWFCVPSFGCAVAAMLFCLRTRDPRERSTLMSIRKMVYAFENDASRTMVMIGSTHCAAEGLKYLIDWKGEQITRASKAILWGAVLFFALPLAVNRAGAVYRDWDALRVAGDSGSHQSVPDEHMAARSDVPEDWHRVRQMVRRESRVAARRAAERIPPVSAQSSSSSP
jgi:hypothetical protein